MGLTLILSRMYQCMVIVLLYCNIANPLDETTLYPPKSRRGGGYGGYGGQKATVPQDYSLFAPPTFNENDQTGGNVQEKTVVQWLIAPHIVSSISIMNMDFTVDLAMRIMWSDPRLTLPPNSERRAIVIGSFQAKEYWRPPLTFTNCKLCVTELINVEKQKLIALKGNLSVSFRETFTFTCVFDLSNYPFDIQKCKIIMVLREYALWHPYIKLNVQMTDDVIKTSSSKTTLLSSIRVPAEFQLIGVELTQATCYSDKGIKVDHVCFSYKFTFERKYMQHILLIFIPSMLIVMISWISFWLNVDMSAPRVALGLTTLLTLSTQFNSAQRDLPSGTAVKALDVWMFTCILMVFATLLEFALANRYRQQVNKVNLMTPRFSGGKKWKQKRGNKIFHFANWRLSRISIREQILSVGSKNIDCVARIVFPIMFITFNGIFWTYYLYFEHL